MRATTAALLTTAFLSVGMLDRPAFAKNQSVGAEGVAVTDMSSRARKRPRVYIYRNYRNLDERGVVPSYFPGPNAVRECNATYAQEFRPSGTVIVPRMSCYWRQP